MKPTFSPNLSSSLQEKIAKYLIEDEVVMNWSVLNKCILMLVLASLVHVIWIVWKVFVLLSPELGALDQFAFAQVSTWTEYLLSDCFYWADLFVFSLAKKCEGTAVAALFMCGHFCDFIMSGWLCHRGSQSCHHDFLHQFGDRWPGVV